jgi:hypothetical protein
VRRCVIMAVDFVPARGDGGVRGVARIAAVGLGVFVVCGSASAVSAASTSPRWFYCGKAVPKNTGAFSDKACSVPSSPADTGEYELLEGVGKGKDIKLKGNGSEEVTAYPCNAGVGCDVEPGRYVRVPCKAIKAAGRPVAPGGLADVLLTFSKCSVLGAPCQSGAARGVITTQPLAGQLGWLEGPHVGIDLTNEAEPGVGPIARFICTEVAEMTLVGSVIAQQTGDTEGVSKELGWRWTIGPYLGEEVPLCSGCARGTPLINTPSFVEGPDDYLETQISQEGMFEGELATGLVGEVTGKGEALEARE